MAQTIAEKLAEKYDVTPSTTIAGTLKKITNDETGDVNIASLVGKMEAGGGGSSRVLLYENDAMTFGQSGADSIKYTTMTESFAPPYWSTEETYTLEIDNQVAASGNVVRNPQSGYYYLGLNSPGDSAGLATYSGGFRAGYSSSMTGGIIIGVDGEMLIDSSKFTAETHSVKIYKEV